MYTVKVALHGYVSVIDEDISNGISYYCGHDGNNFSNWNSGLIKFKVATYSVGCGIAQSGATMPYRSDGVDLTAKSDYPAKTKLIIPLAAYNGNKFAIPAITSNRYLNLNGDNLTYTCVVAYLYTE